VHLPPDRVEPKIWLNYQCSGFLQVKRQPCKERGSLMLMTDGSQTEEAPKTKWTAWGS